MVSLTQTSAIADGISEQEGARAQERIQEFLCQSSITFLRKVVCEVHGNVLVLRGHVGSFYAKQLAQETVRKMDSEHVIVNMLTVECHPKV